MGAERRGGTGKASQNLRQARGIVPERGVAAWKDGQLGAAGLVDWGDAQQRVQQVKKWFERIGRVLVRKHHNSWAKPLGQAGAEAFFERQGTQGSLVALQGVMGLESVNHPLFALSLFSGGVAKDRPGSPAEDLADPAAGPRRGGGKQTGRLAKDQAKDARGMLDGERQRDCGTEFRPEQNGAAQSQMVHEGCEQADAAFYGEGPGIVSGAAMSRPVDQQKPAAGWRLLPQEPEVAGAVAGGVKAEDR